MHNITVDSFLKDVSNHEMTIIRDDGVYRHVRFSRPLTFCMHFDLITWPGHLCYTGDMGTFVFSRDKDMFSFFRSDKPFEYINTEYWEEKCNAVDASDGTREYSPDKFREIIKDLIEDDDCLTDELKEAVEHQVLSYAEDGEYAARQAADRFEVDCQPYFKDFWEVRLTVNTYRFVWCCHAIPWAIGVYDKAKEVLTIKRQGESND